MKRKCSKPNKTAAVLLCLITTALFTGCSVVSKDIRRDAAEDIKFASLKRHADKHEGKTLILGGYILETRNLEDETRLLVLQAPLGIRDEPEDRDRSEGRFMVICENFLDPEIYEKDRKITVAGKLLGTEKAKINEHEYLLPAISCRQIHLWQERPDTVPYYHDPFYPWPGPFYPYRPYHYPHPYYYR